MTRAIATCSVCAPSTALFLLDDFQRAPRHADAIARADCPGVIAGAGARVLLLLANFGKDRQPEPILPKISQELLAEMVGTTRSRVSFFMNKFRKLGLISYNGKIEVNSSLLNAVLYDKPEIKSEP